MKEEFEWNPEPLKTLKDKAGITNKALALMTGISTYTINRILRGGEAPSVATVIKLADYFAVPVDYILGRCSEEDYRRILDNYERAYRELRKESYDGYLRGAKRQDLFIAQGYEAPWPYNLVEKIVDGEYDELLTEDHLAGINAALSDLTDRERTAVKRYYEEETHLSDIGKEFHVSAERVRQIIRKAIRKLRSPRLSGYILNGYALEMANREQTEKLHAGVIHAQKVRNEETYKNAYERALANHDIPITLPIEELDLSIRAYNCLKRAHLYTVDQVINRVKECGFDSLCGIRNLGRNTLDEILKKFYTRTGIDLRDYQIIERGGGI